MLNLGSNELCTLPSNLSCLHSLQELNLSSNNFSSDSTLVNPNALMRAISTIPNLRKLNLSRNKFVEFHYGDLPENNERAPPEEQVFPYLEELYFAFNQVPTEDKLFYPVMQIPSLKYLVITGNPFATASFGQSQGSALVQSGQSLENS